MSRPGPAVRRSVRRATLLIPDQVAGLVPGPPGARLRAVREWQRQEPLRPPEGLDPLDNVAYNRNLWNWYATRWDRDEFRLEQVRREGRADGDAVTLDVLGDEWGDASAVKQVVAEWIHPHVTSGSVAGEIGTGGGRIARLVAPEVGEFHAFDVAPLMLDRARRALDDFANCHFHVVDRPRLPVDMEGCFDFIYSFDVFVHLDLHTQWSYLQEFARVLKPGGRAFVHTANLASDGGWDRFSRQEAYRVEGFYFVVPEMVELLARRAGLEAVEELSGGSGNFYYERDYLILLEKPSGSRG